MIDNIKIYEKNETESPPLAQKLFPVIRAGLDLGTEPLTLSEEECAELFAIGVRQSIQAILFRGLRKLGAPEDVLRECDRERHKVLYQFVRLNEALKSISAALDEEEIPYVPLKGAVLRRLYPAPELRSSCDIDVLVHEDNLDRAVDALEARTDFKMQDMAYHDASLLNSDAHLELHFSLRENDERIDPLLDRAWDYALPAGEGCRYVFTPEYQVFHVIAHMSYHFMYGGLGIRPFLDLWLLRHKTRYDEDEVRQMCLGCGILTFYEQCCALSEVWLGNSAHTETTEMLEAFCLSGGVFGSPRFWAAGRQREKQGLRYILSRVFPPPSQVKPYYQDKSGKDHILPYYYLKRLFLWLGKNRRKVLKSKVTNIFAVDSAYRDSVEELFRRLGL